MISEALQRVQFSEFIKTVDISELQTLFRTENWTPESIESACKCCQSKINESYEAVSLFKDRCSKASKQFQNFNIFLESIALVLRDLTQSYHESNLELDLSAFRRTMPLPFAFDRVN